MLTTWNVQPSRVSPDFGQDGAFAPGRCGFGIAYATSGLAGGWGEPTLVQAAQTATHDINIQRITAFSCIMTPRKTVLRVAGKRIANCSETPKRERGIDGEAGLLTSCGAG
jgi:hypothetical protein